MEHFKKLSNFDPEVTTAIKQEANRIETTIDLIASENYASPAVMQATGSVMTNKYAEGYPHKRYYGGCEFVDVVEDIAKERLLKVFNLDPETFHANVQPHSGSQANTAAYFAVIKPGDTILGMDLAAGGHLTHGYKINFSGTFYKTVSYGVDPNTELLDYNEIARLAQKHKPALIIAGASAYSKTIDFEKFKTIADAVGAKLLIDMAHIAGLVATGLHPSPFEHADIVTSTTHKTLRGPRGGIIICKKEYGQAIDKAVMPGIQGGPLMHHVAAKAVAFKEALDPAFKTYQQQVIKNAQALADEFTKLGYRVVSNGTDNHLIVIDIRSKNITGKVAEAALMQADIVLNKNCIPNDPEKPFVTSGIRIGTPAMTTRGFKEAEAGQVVQLIDQVLSQPENTKVITEVKAAVKILCKNFPVYGTSDEDTFITPAQRAPELIP